MAAQTPTRTAARADLARLLSACYYEPTAAFAEERVFEAMAEAATRIDAPLAEASRRLGAAAAHPDLFKSASARHEAGRRATQPEARARQPGGASHPHAGPRLHRHRALACLAHR